MVDKTTGDFYEVTGGATLKGSVEISGSKNASLPIMAASILASAPVELRNVPQLRDVSTMADVLANLGASVGVDGNTINIDASDISNYETSFELMNRMRASIYVMGPLLARFGRAKAALPGGCAIGARPIDYHLGGFEKMGVQVKKDHGFIDARCNRLKGERIYLDFPSVGATANLMMAGVLAEGTTVIENAAQEPHIQDLAWFLKSIGGRVNGAGSRTITINGVTRLHSATHQMIPDQIEAGTFLAAAALTRGSIQLTGARMADLKPIVEKLREAGASVRELKNAIKVSARKKLKPVRITTLPHPGFPTDMQPQMMALLSTADGVSIIKETVWENRFLHVAELGRMGADLEVQGNTCIVNGGNPLTGSKVVATDLRAGAALVIAGLAADNHTTVYNIFHIDRGYENFHEKISALGADIKRIARD